MCLYTLSFNIKIVHTVVQLFLSLNLHTDTIRPDNLQASLLPDIFDGGPLHGIHLQHVFQ